MKPALRGLAAIPLAGWILMFTTQPVLATCYGGGNEGANVTYTGTSVAKGVLGEVDLYVAFASAGRAIVHPMQVGGGVSDDFVGWGTARGVGVDNCPDNYDQDAWQVYADGTQNLQYWCRQNYGSLAETAANQSFKIKYGTCTASGLARWVFYLNGTEKTCALMNITSGTANVGSESIGTVDTQTLRVDYENLQVNFTSGWAYWGSSSSECETDSPYYILKVTNREYEVRQ